MSRRERGSDRGRGTNGVRAETGRRGKRCPPEKPAGTGLDHGEKAWAGTSVQPADQVWGERKGSDDAASRLEPRGAVGTHSTLPGLHGVSELGERPGQAEGSGTPGARAWGSVSAPSLDKPARARAGGCVLSVSGLTKQPVCPASQDSALGMPRAQPRLPVVSEATLWAHFLCAPGFARSTSCGPPGAPPQQPLLRSPFPG